MGVLTGTARVKKGMIAEDYNCRALVVASAVRARRFVGSLASCAVSRARARMASVGLFTVRIGLAGARQNMRVRIPSNYECCVSTLDSSEEVNDIILEPSPMQSNNAMSSMLRRNFPLANSLI